MNLEDFEKARPPRRAQMDLVLTRGERHRLLVEWGASGQDVIEAIRMIIRVKNQRRQTVNNLGSYDRIEEVFENIVRSAKNVICQSSSNTAARKLQEDSERAATMKKMQTSGQATSFTANETLTASTAPKRVLENRSGNVKESKPPFREVSVHKDFDSCSNSDAGEGPPQHEASSKLRNSAHDLGSPPTTNHMEKDVSYGYDDVDDMSNPQSHDHHQEPNVGASGHSSGRTVDI